MSNKQKNINSIFENAKDHFNYAKCIESEDSIKFIGVCLNEELEFPDRKSIGKDDTLYAVEISSDGKLRIYDTSVDKYYSTTNPEVLKHFFGYKKEETPLSNLSSIQTDGIAHINSIISLVKSISIEDVSVLKNSLGPSLEERILRNIIDAVIFDNPTDNGLANGV